MRRYLAWNCSWNLVLGCYSEWVRSELVCHCEVADHDHCTKTTSSRNGVARILLRGGAWRTGSEVRGDKVIHAEVKAIWRQVCKICVHSLTPGGTCPSAPCLTTPLSSHRNIWYYYDVDGSRPHHRPEVFRRIQYWLTVAYAGVV